jgi:putative aldouronate transport system permease protein
MIGKKSKADIAFDTDNYIIMTAVIVISLYPFWYVTVCSLSDSGLLIGRRGVMLWPEGFNLNAYLRVISNPNILNGYGVTLILVVFGTALNMFMTSLGAFVLSRKNFAVKRIMMMMIVFTMYFSGGMIPTYLLIYKYLNLGDNLLALILPGAINTWNLIILRTNFLTVPAAMAEAAKIDGASEYTVLFRVMLPLCLPAIAVLTLFYGVAHWNSWFNAMLYMRDPLKYPLQLKLREILLSNSMGGMAGNTAGADAYSVGESIKYATIIVATLPIMLVYPFIQKYFVKGVMVGAIKG